MNYKKIMIDFAFALVISFLATLAVSYFYGLIVHGVGVFEWETSCRFALIFGIIVPFMADQKKHLLRVDENVHAAMVQWAADDKRSVNAQMEFLLTEALQKAGRWKQKKDQERDN